MSKEVNIQKETTWEDILKDLELYGTTYTRYSLDKETNTCTISLVSPYDVWYLQKGKLLGEV